VEDIHKRLYSTDYAEREEPPGIVRFVGAANGRFSAQVAVGSSRKLTGLRTTCTELRGADGEGAIPAAAVQAAWMAPHPVNDMGYLSRGGRDPGVKFKAHQVRAYLEHYGPPGLDPGTLTKEELERAGESLAFFDHIKGGPPDAIPADACRPLWLTLAVPADAAPGLYRGIFRIEAEGMEPIRVPVEADVLGWRLPDTAGGQVVLQIEQSPYAVAEHYKVPPWSDRHFRFMERSFAHLGRIGNDWLFIPVLMNTELGNLADSPLRWVRKPDGSLAFDYRIMDRYIDLAVKHMGVPRVICFLVMHGGASKRIEVPLHDERTGKMTAHDVGPNSPTYAADWRAFGRSLYAHMQRRGLERAMHFGYRWDAAGDPNLFGLLAPVAPDVWWAAGGHGHGYEPHYKAVSKIYGIPYGHKSRKGWKRENIFLLNPRGGGTVLNCNGASSPAVFRLVVDRALVAGCNGVGRIAADYWDNIYFRGCKAWHYLIPGMGIASWTLWPGEAGAESSQRFEVLSESVQEGEARIFLEQAVDRGRLPPDLARRVEDVLFRHNAENLFIPISASGRFVPFFSGWQDRSRRLFGAAAEAASVLGLDVGRPAIAVTVPARGKRRTELKIRNWTPQPRAWRIEGGAPWLVPEKTEGTARGHDTVALMLDAGRMESGKQSKAGLTVVDTASGNRIPVVVTAAVGKVFDFREPDSNLARMWWKIRFVPHKGKVPFNVTPGGSETVEVVVLNRSAVRIPWKAAGSAPWVKVEPVSGAVAPASPIVLRVTVAPPDKGSACHDAAVTVAESGGPARLAVPLAVHVIPPYVRPAAPEGEAVPVSQALLASLVKSDRSAGSARVSVLDARAKKLCGGFKKRGFKRSMRGAAPFETVLNIEGKGYSAFAAEVGFPGHWVGVPGLRIGRGSDADRLNFEVYVDGTLRTQSGMMGPEDAFRLLVADGLKGAKQLRLVVRPSQLPADYTHVHWLDPAFYK
jgi:hypothetical protein